MHPADEPVIGQGNQRILDRPHQGPAEALLEDRISEHLLERAQSAGGTLDLEKQHPTAGEDDQIGKARMDTHTDQDGLPDLCPAIAAGDFICRMMDNGGAGQNPLPNTPKQAKLKPGASLTLEKSWGQRHSFKRSSFQRAEQSP